MPSIPPSVGTAATATRGFLSSLGSSQGGQMVKDIMKSKTAKGTILGGLFLAGVAKEVVRPTMKAAMDVAFDDPNADQKVLGTDLTPSMLIGGSLTGGSKRPLVGLGGAVAGAAGGAALGKKYYGNQGAVIGGIAGFFMGGAAGTIAGGDAPAFIGGQARAANAYRFGAGATNPYYAAKGIGALGSVVGAAAGGLYGYNKGGRTGAILGAIGGGLAGGAVGGAIGAGGSVAYANQYARTNAPILSGSPFYNQSLMTADRMNARGDIVLGAYNTRRGQY